MIEYRDSADGITADQLAGPFFAGWADPPSPETHLRILRNSDHVVLAIRQQDQAVVGFVTAISDEVLAAYIPLLEVVEEHRGRGIGSELVRRLLDRIGDLYMVDAMADPNLGPFYRHLGLLPMPGAAIRNPGGQPGRAAG